jgi:diacylglycerol O-acyltransferase / wax synthase
VTDRLSALDVSFLYMETPTTAMHVGGVAVFEPPAEGFDYDRLVELISQRIGLVPRYRQKVRWVPGHLANPVWVDDPDFDVTYHVRRSALPRPGTDAQLRDLVGRLQSRQLDRNRPLWEIYLVEGLADGRVALITKTHHAMVDGLGSMDVGAMLLDTTPVPRETAPDEWDPAPEPSAMELAIDAVLEAMRRPQTVLDVAARAGADAREVLANAERAVAALVSATGGRPVHPLNAVIGEQRRFGTARAALTDHQAVRAVQGGTVNDVVLTVVAGGLRQWMRTRGDPLRRATTVRALVPVSVRSRRNGSGERAAAGNNISAYFVELPVGEPDPLCRLARVSAAMAAHKAGGQAVGAATLIRLAGFAPPTLHSLGVRLASQFSSQVYNVLVSNVPGPPRPLYAMGARMLDMYPVVPLAGGQAVAVGITSYDGVMHYGLNADRDAMPDVDVLAAAMTDALAELVSAATT